MKKFLRYRFLPARGGLLSLLVLAAVLASTLDARVYVRRGRGTGQPLDADELGWQPAGSGRILLNGRPSSVQVFAAPTSGQRTIDRLQSIYGQRGAETVGWAGPELGWGMAAWPDRLTRFLVVSPRMFRQTLVFVVHSDTADPAGVEGPLPGIPDYPGARPGSLVQRPDAGLSMRFLFTRDPAPDILAFYDQSLAASGWSPLIADAGGARAAGPLAVYTRGRSTCYVSISGSREPGSDHVVTVLLQERGSP